MFWLILATVLLLVIGWMLLSPLELEVDTRIPHASVKWQNIGTAEVVYENQLWLLSFHTFFYRHTWPLSRVFGKSGKRRIKKSERTGKSNFKMPLSRMLRMLSSFRVKEWRLALDANDSLRFAMAYPLNFFPLFRNHVQINFEGITYFHIRISNRAWRMVYAWIK